MVQYTYSPTTLVIQWDEKIQDHLKLLSGCEVSPGYMESYLREKCHGLSWDCSSVPEDMLAMTETLNLILCMPQIKLNIRLNYDLIYENDTYKKITWKRMLTHTFNPSTGEAEARLYVSG